ncbi:exonuclease SbcC [Parabacteroides sp. PF5-5]|uniref:AAA family ATPase n=1 Tax=unclassified Parabacteroides TaxID=2649774 RepID=UPI0024740B16|nr:MULTISPECIES: AAA family ATPase [unclassified Parabacteroides]MDH6306230.1 exonuclease SbcC [Parabacteroides sp. PH5-39]MDH6317189.1 exonuclease SbcC [Parabacteroides sp. PF5-13]MDH6320942.1 exonuclease SbcC [Parabacteroides sp. PH5-13]MDH6324673.1 exonuclease SbcC [Parabacteroides sp. PH5-8]MDH6328276.1 exonuclease SbcC [Parabacteroides sp. PH5-41]
MKILAIRGRNLASLEGEFAVDFMSEPLLSAGIYAISGPTGAGKSTILDALCLALFSKTPRTDQAKENSVKVKDVNDDTLMQGDPRFILRRGTASGYAEVDFLALNGYHYRSRWSIARAREKENGRLQNPRLTLHNLDTGEEEQGSRSDIQNRIIELVGLTFDQFTRSVLLAQNDFSTFLKADQGDKASLLEKLTGTEQYSVISRLIFEKNSQAREAYEKLRMQIEGIDILPEEEEKELTARLKQVDKTYKQLEKRIAERKRLLDTIAAAQQSITNRQKQQQGALEALNKALELLETSKKSYAEAEKEHLQLQTVYQNMQPELKIARQLDIRLETERKVLEEARGSLAKASKEQETNDTKLKQLATSRQKRADEMTRLQSWIEKYKSKEKTAEQLEALLIRLDHASEARKAKEKAEQGLKSLQKKQTEVEESIRKLDLPEASCELPEIESIIVQSRNQWEVLVVEQTRFVTSGDVKALRDKLMEGTPCPVCGSTEHPYASAHIIERFVKMGDEIAALKKRIDHLEQLARLVSEKKKNSEQQAIEQQEISRQVVLLNNSLTATNDLFGNEAWQLHWQENEMTFREKLTTFATEWKRNKELLLQLENQQKASETELRSYQDFQHTLQQQVEGAKTAYETKAGALEKIQAERSLLLGGKAADVVEKELNLKLDDIKNRKEKLQQLQTEQVGIAEQSRGIQEQISKELAATTNELLIHQKALESWMEDYNHTFADAPAPDEYFKEQTRQKSELEFRLRKQEENKQKIASLQQELTDKRNVSERWAKLNELAGSADGAKFRRIAQGYTLDVLLDYANVQLRYLTNRYFLERVPDTLALQVIDRDMCDEVRTVHSLSGGESFLVSLALALGLSSLSSNRMKVESLFIDEGFGSLDADTLRMALDALESLRTQGRKIGVISHVQEMTERIPVQIKVVPSGNGRSHILN